MARKKQALALCAMYLVFGGLDDHSMEATCVFSVMTWEVDTLDGDIHAFYPSIV